LPVSVPLCAASRFSPAVPLMMPRVYVYVSIRTHDGDVMTDEIDKADTVPHEPSSGGDSARGVASPTGRRAVLMLGAVAASSVVTIRPALASTTTSVLNCRIPIPDPGHSGKYIAQDGTLVDQGTKGAVRPPVQPLTGTQVQNMLNGATPPGSSPSSRQAYVNYLGRLQQGTAGFTCYASVVNPRRG
jgi:hypothetical protein